MHELPPLLWLQAFESAARTLSFTAAGQELGVTQAAISQRVRLLEDRIGQKLFVRHPRSLALTPAGQAWMPSIQEAFSRISEGTAEVFGITGEQPVTLRTTPIIQTAWLAPRIIALRRRHPGIALRLVSAIWPDDFGPAGADIEIRYGRGDWGGVEKYSLGEERLVPVCEPKLAARLTTPADLAGQTLLHAIGFGVGWAGWCQAAGVPDLESRCHALACDNQITTLTLARGGGGVALTHRRLLGMEPGLVPPFDVDVTSDEQFWLVRPKRRRVSDDAARVWQWLVDSR
ncbi:LysR substrate-binding domain-containing protein [Halomonas sp. HNIBRBA4712]|uniref:LysR substrate-binding domain-containing protein n=1 Tax=Halomonas sp. HNIBRBA4712 TaxID=3373087 RepID=UPI0037451D7F